MRLLCAAAVVVFVAAGLLQAGGEGKKAEIKGPHICCKSCENSVLAVLGKVDGVTDVKCDRKGKTVTFTAKNQDAARKALEAMVGGGFAGELHYGDMTMSLPATAPADKTEEVTVKGVHACCGQCHKAIQALFEGSKVTITGTGPQRDVTVAGKDLTPADVVQKLQKAGFSGKAQGK